MLFLVFEMEGRLCLFPAPVESSSTGFHDNPLPLVQRIPSCCQLRVKKEDEMSTPICPGANPLATGCNSPVNDDIHEQNNTLSAFEWSESKQDVCSFKNTCRGNVPSIDFKMENIHDIETSLTTDSIYKKYLSDSELSHEIKFEHTSDSESTLQLHQENSQVKTEYELPATDCNYPVNDNVYKQESSILEWNESKQNLSSIDNIKTEYELPATGCNYPVNDNAYKQESSAVGWIESEQNLCSIENVRTEYELPASDCNYPVNDNLYKQESSSFERFEFKQNFCSIENMSGAQSTWNDFKMKNNDNIESILPTTSIYKNCLSDAQSSHEVKFEHTLNSQSTPQLLQENLQIKTEYELPTTSCNYPVNDNLYKQESSSYERIESKQNLCSIENMCGGQATRSDFEMKHNDNIEFILPNTSNYEKCLSNLESSQGMYFEHASNGESILQLHQENVIQFENEHCSKSWHVIHERSHNGEKPYKCDICFKSFALNYSLFTHKKDHHFEEKQYKCDICSKSFTQKYYLLDHKLTHTENMSYKCDICLKSFATKSQLITHERSHTGDKLYKCDICSNSFSHKGSIVRHMESHTKEKLHRCNICKKSFLRKYQLFKHELQVHVQEKPYKCEICSKSFSHKYDLTTHERSHTGEKPYKCNICLKSYTQKPQLIKHERSHSEERPFKCDLCSKDFAQRDNFVRHVKSHTAEKLHKCDICFKSFARKSDLVSHKLYHLDVKPHKCNICPKSFAQKQHLIKHQRTHTGEKPFKCDICFKSFAMKSYIAIHKRSHSGEKPYKCDICFKSFASQSNFQKHFKSHNEKLC
ncbi:uncharacterized protein LOC143915907 [Arctopsyche grandis]|uniref:uncharacterized protein LOC143915907 n=1 Tax=Arctopsyche grandis TaxID=121162 RepID=UPI00406D921A